MDWWILLLAGAAEIAWAVGLKYSDGFKNIPASVFTVIAMLLSFILLSRSFRTIPMGTAYAVWTGIGVIGTAAWGVAFFGESRETLRILCILLILCGIVGLRIFTK